LGKGKGQDVLLRQTPLSSRKVISKRKFRKTPVGVSRSELLQGRLDEEVGQSNGGSAPCGEGALFSPNSKGGVLKRGVYGRGS